MFWQKELVGPPLKNAPKTPMVTTIINTLHYNKLALLWGETKLGLLNVCLINKEEERYLEVT